MKNKWFIILAIIIIIIIIIITAILLMITKKYINSDNYETDFEQEPLYESAEEIQLLDNRNKYFAIKRIMYSILENVQKINGKIEYNGDISLEEENDLKEEALKEAEQYFDNVLDKQYKQEMQVQQDIIEMANKYNEGNLILDKVYVYDKSVSIDIMIVYAYIGNEEFNAIVKIDNDNQTYSIFLQDYMEKYNYSENMSENNIKINDETIKLNDYNEFQFININDETMAQYYLYDYGEKVSSNIDLAYQNIEEEYRKERFPRIENYKQYIESSEKNYDILELKSYLVEKNDDYTMYICIDQYGNKYNFKETSVMQYTLQLDSYTIENETFREKYATSNNKERGILNVDKFFEMLNMQDYESAYKVLDDSFKQNNFQTQADFENYIKQHTFKYNNVSYKQYTNKISSLHTYNIELTDATQNSQEIYEHTIIVKLLEDTKFSIAFEIN